MPEMRELKLSYKRKRIKKDLLSGSAESPEYVYRLFKAMENEVREKLVCLHLTDRYEIISCEVVSLGTQKYTVADPAEILRSAILVRASKIIIIHNHPLTSAEPSAIDIKSAKQLKEKGQVLNIDLYDELIIGEDGFVSLRERGSI